jgi:hypothetical protein
MKILFLIIFGAVIIHIFEEYYFGWLKFVKRYNFLEFTIFNAFFLALCIVGVIIGEKHLVFGLSIASLIFINALIHIVSSIKIKKFLPGTFSAVFFYIPLSIYTYYFYVNNLSFLNLLFSIILGFFWMIIPLVYTKIKSKL